MDRYTKFVLTVIAVALSGNVLLRIVDVTNVFIGSAEAQAPQQKPTPVVIVGWQFAEKKGFPVYVSSVYGSIPVDLSSMSGGKALPVSFAATREGKPVPVTIQNQDAIPVVVKSEKAVTSTQKTPQNEVNK